MGTWVLEDGTKVNSITVKDRFADGEYIIIGGKKVLVNGTVNCMIGDFHNVTFSVYGLSQPWLRCYENDNGLMATFRDDAYSPKMFESYWKKHLSRQEFSGEVGKLMIERLPDIMDYKFKL